MTTNPIYGVYAAFVFILVVIVVLLVALFIDFLISKRPKKTHEDELLEGCGLKTKVH